MSRLILVLTVMTVMARVGLGFVAESSWDNLRLDEAHTRSDRLDSSIQGVEALKAVLQQTLGDLSAGDVTLAQAVARIEETARSKHPSYLRALVFQNQRQPSQGLPQVARSRMERQGEFAELIAHNLLWHLETEISSADPEYDYAQEVVARVKKQLAEMFPPSFCLVSSRD